MKAFFKYIIVAVLTLEAKLLLKRTKPIIIAITGSVGKTSVKDAIYAALKDHVHARKSEKSYNSEIGVPLTVLGLRNGWNNPIRWLKNILDGLMVVIHPGQYPKILILEVGVDRPGDMDRLTSWVKPDVVVLTRFPDVPVHVEFFGSAEEVIREKVKLVEALKPDGVLVYNQDDEKVAHVASEVRQQAIGYSRYSLSPFTASGDTIVYENGIAAGFECTITHLTSATVVRINGSLGIPHAYNCAAAAAVASIFSVGLDQVAQALVSYVPPPGRMRILSGIKNTLIIDDTYNSSPVATERALLTLREIKGVKRRIAVLGDMMELGQFSIREHERVGEVVARCADVLITIGIRSRSIASAALAEGMSERSILQYEDVNGARLDIESIIKPGDLILVKGSQSVRTEKIVEEIMAEPEKAEELLVRQDPMWKSI